MTQEPIPLLDLQAQYEAIRDEVDAALARVVQSQAFVLGPEVAAFEVEIAEYCRCRYAVGVSSGTDALLACLMALDVGPGDEVITSAYTFFATAGAIARLGARPVFADIEPGTFNIDVSSVKKALTARTKAIIPVHLFGQMADSDPIMELARSRKIFMIEDAAQAIGSEDRGRRAGSIGDCGCLSFFPSKNLGGFGDGGMVVTSDPDLADRLKLLRNHGYRPKYHSKILGGNLRLDAIQAAVLRVKLKYLDGWNEARRRNADRYRALFRESGLVGDGAEVELPVEVADRRHVYNQFVIRTRHRAKLRAFLKARQIGCEVYYPVPMHLQECLTGLGYRPGDLPESERAARESLALPIYPELASEMQRTVVSTIRDCLATEADAVATVEPAAVERTGK